VVSIAFLVASECDLSDMIQSLSLLCDEAFIKNTLLEGL